MQTNLIITFVKKKSKATKEKKKKKTDAKNSVLTKLKPSLKKFEVLTTIRFMM